VSDTNAHISALLDAARLSIERDDAHSLAFALRRAGELGASGEALALGTSVQQLTQVPAAVAARAVSLLKVEVSTSSVPLVSYALARIYSLGILGESQSDELAFKYLSCAADLGMPIAQLIAGIYAMEGKGTPPDANRALIYFNQAATEGYLVASRNALLLRKDIGRVKRSIELLKLTIKAFQLALQDPSDQRLYLLNPRAVPKVDAIHR
jgi:TPR repeat protein